MYHRMGSTAEKIKQRQAFLLNDLIITYQTDHDAASQVQIT
jgi:hypothetical protein